MIKKKIQELLERFFKCNFRTKVELLNMVKGKSYDILERTMLEQKLEGKPGVDRLRR